MGDCGIWERNKFFTFTMDNSTVYAGHERVHRDIEGVARANSFRIFTSFRLDVLNDPAETKAKLCGRDQPFPFSFHRDRLLRAALALRWQHVADRLSGNAGMEILGNSVISGLSSRISSMASSNALKVRLTVSREFEIGVDHTELRLLRPDPGMRLPEELLIELIVPGGCKLVLDSQPTQPSLFTTYKTTARIPYDNARERANISKVTADYGEVLLFNPNNEIMEASTSTPYFYRNGRWVTPPLSSGGNAGVTRRAALESGLCVEEVVKVASLRDRETVWISNGVRGFIIGALRLHDQAEENNQADEHC